MKNLVPILLFTLALITPISGFAQMSGTVYINSGNPATASNFKDWYSFWRSLQGQTRSDGGPLQSAGVSGALVVEVQSSLTETSRVEFPAITGASATRTITINGNGYSITYPGPYEVISFRGGDHIYINNLVIRNSGTSPNRNSCIRIYNNSDSNRIFKCTLEFSSLSTGAVNGSAFIAFSQNDTNFSAAGTTLTGKFNFIENNLLRTTNSNSPGPSYGISICGSTSNYSNTSHNNNISGNTIENFYFTGILNNYTNGNRVYNNHISRKNSSSKNCNNILYGIVSSNTYNQSRSTWIRKNIITELPHSGASAINGVGTLTCLHNYNNNGTSTYPYYVDSNKMSKLAVLNIPAAGFFRGNTHSRIVANSVELLENYSTSNEITLWENRAGNELLFSHNTVIKSKIRGKSVRVFFTDSVTSNSSGFVDILNNQIEGNEFHSDAYMLLPNNGNFRIANNKILSNSITGNTGGYLFAIASQDIRNTDVFNNLVANNLGHDGFVGIYLTSYSSGTYKCRVWQNTVYTDGSKSPAGSGYDNNGIFIETYYHPSIEMSGNIIEVLYGGFGVIGGIDCNDTASVDLWDNNTYHTVKMGFEYWPTPLGWKSNFASYIATGLMGNGENFLNPKFANPAGGDFHSKKWQTQNNVKTLSDNGQDITGANRNKPYSDRGAIEEFSDARAIRTGFSIGSVECSGLEKKIDITVQNLYTDTLYNFRVAYSVNGSSKVSQLVTTKLLKGDSVKVNFTNALKLNKSGNNRIAIFLDRGDDIGANDTFIFNTVINPAPGGGKFTPSAKPTNALYKTGSQPDVTFLGEPVIYDMTPPRAYSNSQYSSHWTATAFARTLPGNTTVSTVTYTPPSGGNNQEIKYSTSNSLYEDSTIQVCVTTRDVATKCDTTICRNVYIQPRVKINFSYPKIVCGNDTAFFKNQSTVKSGGMIFHWNFGTGNAGDTSANADEWFIFPKPGVYKVKLTAYTYPSYFKSEDSVTITVKEKPKAGFSRVNACFGDSVKFNNSTSPSNPTYKWYFGDGQTSILKNPAHKYSAPGSYTVRLVANLDGCADSVKSLAHTFDRPVADFTYASPTPCSNAPYTFQVKGPVTWGSYASYWDFGNGSTSNQSVPTHTFGKSGTQKVKLLLLTGFGCSDSTEKSISVKQAPEVSMSHTEACSLDSTVFQDLTPPINGVVFQYKWFFDVEGISPARNPWHKWASTGTKKVKFLITADNGCKDSLIKDLEVRTQAIPYFTDNSPVCSGSKVVFKNATVWPKGNIGYEWDMADGGTTIIADPEYTYNTKVTTTYNVTLCAKVDGFCSRCYTKAVVVNSIPNTCDFEAEPDYAFGYYGMKTTPKDASTGNIGAQSGVTYSWVFNNSQPILSPTAQYNFQLDGTYNVTMCAEQNTTNCSCCITKQVVMDRASVIIPVNGSIKIHPNPNRGKFQVLNENAEKIKNIYIYKPTGELVYSELILPGNVNSIEADFAPGLYILVVHGQDSQQSIKLVITD